MRRHPFHAWLVLLAAFAMNFTEARARAQSERALEAARAEFSVGVEHADAGRWERAVRSFRRVAEVMPAPPVRFNLASALVELRRFPEAELLLRGLSEDPETSDAIREAASERLRHVRASAGTVRFAPESGDAVLIDGFAIGPEDFGRGLPVSAGEHVVEAYRGGEVVARRRVQIVEGLELRVSFAEAGPSRPAPAVAAGGADRQPSDEPARARPAWLRNRWVWIGVAAAVAVGAGVGAGLAARSNRPYAGNFEPGRLRW